MTTRIEHAHSMRNAEAVHVGRRVALVLSIWGAIAFTVAATVRFTALPRFVVGATILSTVCAGVVAFVRWPALRAWLRERDLRIPIALHVVRLPVGAAFLWELAHDQLPASFALGAGIGDMIAGVGAAIAAWAWPARTPARRRIVGVWNAIALLDIVLVAIAAQREIFFGGGLEAMRAFERFPYPLLPTLIVPLVFLSHFLVAWRLRVDRRA